ncbi:MAG: glycosyl hydrolase [bacterium]
MTITKIIKLTILSLLFVACDNEQVSTVDSISLDIALQNMYQEETYQLNINEDITGHTAVWSSSDTLVATVSESGLVTALSSGEAIIKVTVNGKSAACVVLVCGINAAQLPTTNRSEKRGVSFKFDLTEDVALLAPSVSWSYNWGPNVPDDIQPLFDQYDMDFCPMAWGSTYDSDKIRQYKAENPNCEYLLAFNEPNLTDQANMTPTEVAALWDDFMALANELDMKVVAPAMNYGTLEDYFDPIVWLDEFFTMVPIDDVDVIAIHCYMGSPSALKSYVDRFRIYDKPIWMTEFCAWESWIGSISEQMSYMCDVINYFELDPIMERYAWFIPRASSSLDSYPYMQLLTKLEPYELSDLGRVFAGLPSLQNPVSHSAEDFILAQAYSNLSTSDCLDLSYISAPRLRVGTDQDDILEIADMYTDHWLEYNINFDTATTTMKIRYATFIDATMDIIVDDETVGTIDLPRTGGDTYTWGTAESEISIEPGEHTVRLKLNNGNMAFNWFRFK